MRRDADISTLALLQAVHDYQAAFDASTGWARIELLTPWQTLCAAYPEEAVAAAYAREASSGHLDYGYCACPTTCDLCARQGPPARLTDDGLTRLRTQAAEG
ncbi:hypothetical protein ABZ802_31575 [Streptomyces sp. NPDC047737]|uniref:hypothetical protein n=1 Tax=Streptomyces sp. NPDC047737 TaxID=3155740 RepID=UPI00340978E8